LAHRVLVGLPEDFIQKEAAHSFVDGVRVQKVKQQLIMDGDMLLNETLNNIMKPEAPKAAAGTPARMTMKQMT
jgi:hypothetical protein